MRIRQHVNPLAMAFTSVRSQMPELSRGCDIEVEIGCADAKFLFERAEINTDAIYIGLEIRKYLVETVNAQAQQRKLPVHAIFCNANRHLRQLFPESSVKRVFLNFPDPWFKKRHHKRRMVNGQLARDIDYILSADGEVFFQSDIWALALETMAVFEALEGTFTNSAGSWSFHKNGNSYGAQSWREEHCLREGKAIWRLHYRRMNNA